jgi:mono/diheme cytochrome c family protein
MSAFLLGVSSIAIAQQGPRPAQPQRFDIGKVEYESNCATCHGTMGKGDGPTATYLNRKPSDLTTLAKNNGGVFPVVAMYETITGERQYAGHGTREMPVWGEFYVESPYIHPEAYMRARILAIMEYINRLQAK